MYHLATVVPPVKRLRIPLSRDQIMLLLAAINEIFLGIDIYLAHDISGTIVPNEWIPIIFGPVAGALLLVAGVIALRQRPLATLIATTVLMASIAVGLLGVYFHLRRAALPDAPSGEQVTLALLAWGPPFLGPLMFCLVGLFGLSAAWVEEPPDSGRLRMPGGWHVPLPLSKTRAYFLMFSLGHLITVISAVLDHVRTGFDNRYLWIPVVVGLFATFVSAILGLLDRPHRGDLAVYVLAMGLMMLTGLIGLVLHVDDNLTSRGQFVLERFIRGAPFLAPLLFANMGMLGLVALLDPRSETLEE
ncbi:MAG: hypothetical protein JXA10_03390 [Anaerolineae bacterium]|nr:hypothetical protein [Anaerolineae bacterium]